MLMKMQLVRRLEQLLFLQIAIKMRHGPTAHCDVALAALRQNMVSGTNLTACMRTPATSYSDLLSIAAKEAARHPGKGAAAVPVCQAWHSQQVTFQLDARE
jgi:hypothetical protein